MASTQQSNQQSSSQATSAGNTYFPYDVTGLIGALERPAQFAGQNYSTYLQNPTQHPLFQAQLGPLLQSLIPSEARARTNLTDTFRASGGLRSGAYGREATMLEGELMGRRQQAAGQLLGQSFGQMIQALNSPLQQVAGLINALKLSQQSSQSLSNSSGQSSGQSQDPVQQQQQSSGMTAGSLLQALAGMMGVRPTGPTTSSVGGYSDPYAGGTSSTGIGGSYSGVNNGLIGYGQAYDQYGSPVDEYGYTQQDWANDPYYN